MSIGDPENRAALWEGLGWAALALAICLGIGSCSYLSDLGAAEKARAVAEQKAAKP